MPHLFANLIKADGSFDRAGIVKLAHKWAGMSQHRFYAGQVLPSYREAFKTSLAGAWKQARLARAERALPACEIARRADHASARFGAAMIDHTDTSLRISHAIEARHAQEAASHV